MINNNYLTSACIIVNNEQYEINQIYQHFLPKVTQWIYSVNGTLEDAKDVLQDALIILLKKTQQPDFELQVSLNAYLMQICKYVWMNMSRKKRDYIPLEQVAYYSQATQEIDKEVIRREKHKIMEKHFQKLSADNQKVLTLFYKGYSLAEIADVMEYSKAFVKVKKYRAQQLLIKSLQKDSAYLELMEVD